MRLPWLTAVMLLTTALAMGQGMLVPEEGRRPAEPRVRLFTLLSQQATINVNDRVAETTVEQVFQNITDRPMEAIYLFPVPENAAITRLTMTVGDKIAEGKVLSREEARAIYEGIVARQRDPALLEYAERGLVRLRVFPIPPRGQQKITVRFVETLPLESGAIRVSHLLKLPALSGAAPTRLAVTANIETANPIQTIYSPTHAGINIRRPDARRAVVSWEGAGHQDRDMTLYVRAGREQAGLSLFTYRVGDQGYFLLIGGPAENQDAAELPKRVVFVIDRTGSMAGDKMRQTKEAFQYAINRLKPEDTFNVILFSEQPDAVFETLQPANRANIDRALERVRSVEAAGGTNIEAALKAGLAMFKSEAPGALSTMLFMTDGLPTVGETDVNRILSSTREANKHRVRLFNWGVGYDVNVPFLDKLADQNRGETDYVKPNEQVEVKIAGFVDKIGSPLMTDLKLFFRGVEATDIYPRELPDLFKGGQIVVAGRYRGSGPGAVVLEGLARNKQQSLRLAANFPSRAETNDYIPRLWAMRKIGYLMDEVRLHNNREVIEEIVRLSREFGIVTEYTSFLIDDTQVQELSAGRLNDRALAEANSHSFESRADAPAAQKQQRASRDLKNAPAPVQAGSSFGGGGFSSMGGPVTGDTNELTDADRARIAATQQRVQQVGDRAFYFDGNRWNDSRNDAKLKQVSIKRFSEAHFQLLRQSPRLAKFSAVGDEVLVVVNGQAVIIGEKGKEKLTPAELKSLMEAPTPQPKPKKTGMTGHDKAMAGASVAAAGGLALLARKA